MNEINKMVGIGRNRFLLIILLFSLCFLSFNNKVFAEEKRCNQWANDGEKVCITKSYKGKMCEWNGDLKAGARCYQGDKMTEEKKQEVPSCEGLDKSETCNNSTVKGYDCIWKQNACHNATNNGSDETIIAESKQDRDKLEEQAEQDKDKTQGQELTTIPTGESMTCTSLKNTDTYKIVKQIFKWLQIAAPIMLVIFGVMDFGKAVASGDNDAIKKAQQTFIKRVIIVAIILLLPVIIELLFSLLDGALGNDISTCDINK